jgi:hypothetical protein
MQYKPQERSKMTYIPAELYLFFSCIQTHFRAFKKRVNFKLGSKKIKKE